MARARQARRRRELKELATLMALAFHKPEDIDKNLQPPVSELVRKAEVDPDSWDDDEWWQAT